MYKSTFLWRLLSAVIVSAANILLTIIQRSDGHRIFINRCCNLC